MSINKRGYTTIVSQAKKNVVGFASAYSRFIERVSLDQNSKSMITNYSRSIASVSLHVDTCPVCKKGKMQRMMSFDAHAPPAHLLQQMKNQLQVTKNNRLDICL